MRTTSFASVPLVLGVLLCLVPDRLSPAGPLRAALAVGAAALLLPATVRWNRELAFVPMESWKETAQVVERLFPDRMPVFADAEAGFLRRYLPERFPLLPQVDPARFGAGEILLVDSPVTEPEERLVAQNFFPTLGELRNPQRRARYQALLFAPPARSGIAWALDGRRDVRPPLSDRDVATTTSGVDSGSRLILGLEPGLAPRSLVLLWAQSHPDVPADIRLWTREGGVEAPPTRHWGRTTVVLLDGREGARILLTRRPGAPPLLLAEAWAYPQRLR